MYSVSLAGGRIVFGFLGEVFSVISRRAWWLVVLNWLFFGFVLGGSFLGGWISLGPFYSLPASGVSQSYQSNPILLFGFLFVFNLVVSGFVVVTLTGLAFFALSPIFLCYRGMLWGALLAGLPRSSFLFVLPTIILEGEGYVFAAVAGVLMGLSWLNPEWDYQEESLTRYQSLKRALKDSVYVYLLVASFLFLAAIVETLTLVYI